MARKAGKPKVGKRAAAKANRARAGNPDRPKAGKVEGLSKTTTSQLVSLVREHDEKTGEMERLKADRAGVKGELTAVTEDIFTTARAIEDDDKPESRKKLAGYERNREKKQQAFNEVSQALTAVKETRKKLQADVFDLIRDSAQGKLLFDQKGSKEEPKKEDTGDNPTE